MFGNSYLDSLPDYEILQNIADKTDNENAINQLNPNVRSFVVVKKYLQQRQGQAIELNEIFALGVNFDALWLIVFLIAFRQGFQSISVTTESITYTG